MKLILIFILSIIIAITVWIGVSLLAYYIKYCKGDSIVHFLNIIQANYDLHQLNVKRQIEANNNTSLIEVVEAEEVPTDEVPLKWKVSYNGNSTQYSTEIQSF